MCLATVKLLACFTSPATANQEVVVLCTSPLKGSLENAFGASVGEVFSLQAVTGFKQTLILDSGHAEWSLGLYLTTVSPKTVYICAALNNVSSVIEREEKRKR